MNNTVFTGELQVCVECGKEDAIENEPCRGEKLLELCKGILGNGYMQQLKLRSVACLGNCDHRCRFTIVSTHRWSWSLGDIDPDHDAAFLKEFITQWINAPKGLIAKKDRSEDLVEKALGRHPPIDQKEHH